VPRSQIIGPGDHPGPNLVLAKPGAQHRNTSLEIHAAGILCKPSELHPGPHPGSSTPERSLRVIVMLKQQLELGLISATLGLAGGIGIDLLLLATLAGTFSQAVGGLAELLQEVGRLGTNVVSSLKNSRECALPTRLLVAEASHPEGVDHTAELGVAMGHVELLDDFVGQRLLALPLDPGNFEHGLLVVLAARLNKTRGITQAGQQLRSTRLHVVDDQVVVSLIDWRDVDVEARGVTPAKLRDQCLDLCGIVKALRL
jgi:hypothetical protein